MVYGQGGRGIDIPFRHSSMTSVEMKGRDHPKAK